MVMPSIIGGSIAAAGAVGAGAASARSASKNNAAMLDYQKHRYQYTTKDLRAAGLNPILATKGLSPGNAPTLQQPNTSAIASGLSSAGNVIAQGYQAKTARNTQEQQGELIDSQIMQQKAQIANSAVDTLNKIKQGDQIDAQTRYINEQTITQDAQRALMAKQGSNYSANTARTQYDTVESRRRAEFYNTEMGQAALENNITSKSGPVIGPLSTFVNWIDHAFKSNSAKTESTKPTTPRITITEGKAKKQATYNESLINNYKR